MKSRTLKLFMETIGALTNLSKGLDINKEAVTSHSNTLNEARKKLEKYNEQWKNKEYMSTLSPPEQQNLSRNASEVYRVHEMLEKELDYLDMTKHPVFVAHAISALDKAYVVTEYFYKEKLGECGDVVTPKFYVINLKYVSTTTYRQMVDNLYTELDALTADFIEEVEEYATKSPFASTLMLGGIMSHLVEATMWFLKEKERLGVEGLPEFTEIKLPEETLPEIPAGPETDQPSE